MTVTCSCSVHCGINPSGNWVRSLIPNFHRLTTVDLRANVNATSDLACQHAVSSDMTQCCSSAIHARSQRSSFKHMVMTDVKTGPAHHLLQLDTQVAIGHSTDEIPPICLQFISSMFCHCIFIHFCLPLLTSVQHSQQLQSRHVAFVLFFLWLAYPYSSFCNFDQQDVTFSKSVSRHEPTVAWLSATGPTIELLLT